MKEKFQKKTFTNSSGIIVAALLLCLWLWFALARRETCGPWRFFGIFDAHTAHPFAEETNCCRCKRLHNGTFEIGMYELNWFICWKHVMISYRWLPSPVARYRLSFLHLQFLFCFVQSCTPSPTSCAGRERVTGFPWTVWLMRFHEFGRVWLGVRTWVQFIQLSGIHEIHKLYFVIKLLEYHLLGIAAFIRWWFACAVCGSFCVCQWVRFQCSFVF